MRKRNDEVFWRRRLLLWASGVGTDAGEEVNMERNNDKAAFGRKE